MISKIKEAIALIENVSKNKPIKVISHNDTDGITSAAIFSRILQRWKKNFSLEITKSLDQNFIMNLPETHLLIFLDLGSNSLEYLKQKKTEIVILDHHEIIQQIPENVTMINPLLFNHDQLSGAGVCYMFGKTLSPSNRDLANLAVIGMIGDSMEKELNKTYSDILKDSETTIKKGLLFYPSTRPLDKVLEFSSGFFIPGVTGSYKGVLELLRDANISKTNGQFKSICELNEQEMSALTTAIMLKYAGEKNTEQMIGNIYLIKFFNKQEDCREISALINACSRMGKPGIAMGLCLGNNFSKEEAQKIYIEYKHNITTALRYVSETEKIAGKNYLIINAKNNVKDTIIGTVASIMSNSPIYEEGTIIVALAYDQDRIKVSARSVGRQGQNVREVLNKVVVDLGGEVGGHPRAAGCLIPKEKGEVFISQLQKVLEIETIKV